MLTELVLPWGCLDNTVVGSLSLGEDWPRLWAPGHRVSGWLGQGPGPLLTCSSFITRWLTSASEGWLLVQV